MKRREEGQERHKDGEESDLQSEKAVWFFLIIFLSMTTFTREKGQEKGKIKECKGKSENATVAKLVSRLIIKKRKRFGATECQEEALCLFPDSLCCFNWMGGNEKESHHNAYLLFDSSAENKKQPLTQTSTTTSVSEVLSTASHPDDISAFHQPH